jgi:hypothetical protein
MDFIVIPKSAVDYRHIQREERRGKAEGIEVQK